MNEYSALIMDLKKSKAYSVQDRNSIQEFIMRVIEILNFVFRSSVEKDVAFSAGDEVQGLFSSPEAAYLYFRWFNMLISPVEIRAGIGIGNWDVVVRDASTTAQDGSAYHYARHAIEETRESLGYSVLLFSNTKKDIIINSLMNAATLIINKHSEYQNELMLLSELIYPIQVEEIVDCTSLQQVFNLVRHKNSLQYYDFLKRRKIAKPYPFEMRNGFSLQSVPVDAIQDGSTFFVTGGKRRGLALQLSELIGVSRQSIEKTIKTASIYEARNATVATLKLMHRRAKGDSI